ncbi:hypothetical protein, partial [Streptomyces sp. 7-21]|uniref:hypothetical protein n=1 Tax=Streptomyces sp. 7-21 TaxID=2802283 RepID=UPI00191DF0C8
FNYLGRFRTGTAAGGPVEPWAWSGDPPIGYRFDPDLPAPHALAAGAVVRDTPDGPELHLTLTWPGGLLDEDDVRRLGDAWARMLTGIATHTADPAAGGHTPSDFPLVALDQDEVEEFEDIATRLEGGLSL